MIYLLEDDDGIRELVIYTLKKTGFAAKGFAGAGDFWKAMKTELPELVLLDIMLPDEDGLSVLGKVRKNSRTAGLPVIMMTAKGSEYDKVIGLDSGADDYLPKPFGMMELVSRIRAVLRRTEKAQEQEQEQKQEVDQLGDIILDAGKHMVKVNGIEVALTYKEFRLLQCLMKHKGLVMTRDQLLSRIWGYDFDGETRTVDVHIRSLRQKLGAAGECIETIRGVGYKVEEN